MLPSVYSPLLELADRLHLVPLVVLFAVLGLLSHLTIANIWTLRHAADVVDAYYEFRRQVRSSRARFKKS
jgi:hypothetical protein